MSIPGNLGVYCKPLHVISLSSSSEKIISYCIPIIHFPQINFLVHYFFVGLLPHNTRLDKLCGMPTVCADLQRFVHSSFKS